MNKKARVSRKFGWLIPGLSIKRWIGLAVLGILCVFLGIALFLNFQPVTMLINFLKSLAIIVPSNISGPIFIAMGGICLYFGTQNMFTTLFSAVSPSNETSFLEALYRRHKLSQGPSVVAIGGGTGLSTLLRGVKHYTSNISAIVTVGDDGGSSGILRKEHGVIPPGDIRNCIAALADEEHLITELFQYRFKSGHGLEGHSFGNLFLTAMCQVSGDMLSAIKESSNVLNIRGRVLPSTLDSVTLVAEMEDGTTVRGESEIPKAKSKIKKLSCDPASPEPLPEVIKAIETAELIILGPGSLYTSVVPNLLIPEIAQAVAKSKAPKVYVANIMTQPGETDHYSVYDHIEAITSHSGIENLIDCVIVNDVLPIKLVEKYRQAGCEPVQLDEERCDEREVEIVRATLIDEKEIETLRHDPHRVVKAIMRWFKKQKRYNGPEELKEEQLILSESLEKQPHLKQELMQV